MSKIQNNFPPADPKLLLGIKIAGITKKQTKNNNNNFNMSGNIPITGGVSKMSLSPPSATSPPVSSSFDLNLARLSSSPSYSTSPPDQFKMPGHTRRHTRSGTEGAFKQLKPFASADIKILLLENVAQTGVEILKKEGYQIEFHKTSLPEDQLIEKIRDVQAIGIRSKTKLTENVLKHAQNLVCIGCFCIGTNQVDLEYAAKRGIAVFNSPFSNSRSVAELVMSEIIALSRQYVERTLEMKQGLWNKVSNKCWEVRGKTLGIIGYGHIGSQLSVLAESMGMQVIFYDIFPIMSLGTAKQLPSLHQLLRQADFVTLHVPELPETKNMISRAEFEVMKKGSYLINASRGTVVDIPALIDSRRSGKIAGFALDVYPNEPAKNGQYFDNNLNEWALALRSLTNIIITPHIGGSTEEAQGMIGVEVADSLLKYINEGSSTGAVNFPEVSLRSLTIDEENHARVCVVHHNMAGALREFNNIFSEVDINVDKQFSDSRGDVAYMIADISEVREDQIKDIYKKLAATPFNIVTRMLY